MTLDTRTLAGPVAAPVAHTLPPRPMGGPVPITDAGRWGRRYDVAAAGSAIVAEAARLEPGDYDPNWNRLLQTSQALDLLLGLGTARLAG